VELSRRDLLKLGIGAGAAAALDWREALAWTPGLCRPGQEPLLQRAIPSSGEMLPVVGIGTARRYNVGSAPEERRPLADTLQTFAQLGGKVVDTAPSYGAAEEVVGDLVSGLGIRDSLFLATKVRAEGIEEASAQIGQSFQYLRTDVIDLMQVHNLVGIHTQLSTLRGMKERGRIRYIGITTSSTRQYEDFERYMRSEELDFVQFNFSLAQRAAEERLLPLAADRGMAVLVNLPYGRGSLFDAVGDRAIPDWAAEWDIGSWGQFFLKYITSHPAVTCVIPGTNTTEYAADNLGAARGGQPDQATRERMASFYDSL
jgi:aryl-alcohol dehydrogenase-like predicted oxidoreductase